MPDEFIDLTVTSPPYDDMDDDFNPIQKNGQRIYNGYSWDFKAIARELFRVTKTGGVVVWIVNDPTINGSESLASSLQKIFFRRVGFNIHDTMIYEKMNPLPINGKTLTQCFEYILVLLKGTNKNMKFNKITIAAKSFFPNWKIANSTVYDKNGKKKIKKSRFDKQLTTGKNILSYAVGGIHTTLDTVEHPGKFPEKLAEDNIYLWSNAGDIIYDPFMGSGTTAKMAHLMKRNWIGSEISQEYVDLSNKRIDPYLKQETLF
jgi:site-specific DNA-methyltransferase (adenine-specific)